MSADLIAVYIVGVICWLLALSIAADVDIRDWGLVGLMLFCDGIAMVALVLLLDHVVGHTSWRGDLRWLWLGSALAGALIVGAGMYRRAKATWPPAWRAVARIALAVVVNLVLVLLIHLIRRVGGDR